jgi:hypothetical protein
MRQLQHRILYFVGTTVFSEGGAKNEQAWKSIMRAMPLKETWG